MLSLLCLGIFFLFGMLIILWIPTRILGNLVGLKKRRRR